MKILQNKRKDNFHYRILEKGGYEMYEVYFKERKQRIFEYNLIL